MNPIDQLFQRLRDEKRRAFIPFLTTGDPSVEATKHVAEAVLDAGADILEIGFPYSDAIADGPVIQASYTRALDKGLRLSDVFDCVKALSQSKIVREKSVPLVGMVSYSLVHRRGIAKFLDESQEAGLSGAIVPDLPFEESGELRAMAEERDFKLIQLVTPTTPRPRAAEIAQASTGFLYCVSVTGITGERDRLPEELRDNLAWLRGQTDLPLCVGFGISKPEHVETLRGHADGVIVGSALVRRMGEIEERGLEAVTGEIVEMVRGLVEAAHRQG